MTIDRLRALIALPQTHRLLLGELRGLYVLAVTLADDGRPALYLSVANAHAETRVVALDDELVPVVIPGGRTGPPRSLGGQDSRVNPLMRLLRRILGLSIRAEYPEAREQRPLVCGLALHNCARDQRIGQTKAGALGCFVTLPDGTPAILSASHVLAAPRGTIDDSIDQPAAASECNPSAAVATLTASVPLITSADGAQPQFGNVVYNDVDAAVAKITSDTCWRTGYLTDQQTSPPSRVSSAVLDDPVFKIGPTTSKTFGKVRATDAIAGVFLEGIGNVWFRHSLVIDGTGSTPFFAAPGDSGSLLVRESTFEALGILYGLHGNSVLVSPLDTCLQLLDCQFVEPSSSLTHSRVDGAAVTNRYSPSHLVAEESP
jgi:hypothetical protein